MKDIILIPTYNECDSISDIISRIRARHTDINIMVIDDNSPDGTAGVVEGLIVRDSRIQLFKREKKEGLGAAYKAALKKVHLMGDIDNIITMDADGSHDPQYISVMLERVKQYDLIVGSRYVRGGGVENWEWYRRLLSFGANIYSMLFSGVRIHDLTAGFVCFKKSLLDSIDFSVFDSSGYAYQIEFKYHCVKSGCSYLEIPIIFRERKSGSSKLSSHIISEGAVAPIRLLFYRMFGRRF